jgi:uncharacterized membrane protein
MKSEERFWEIDFLRGVAVIMMIIFHIFFDLNYFNIYNVDLVSGFWFLFARLIASTFIFLVGITLTISYARAVKQRKYRAEKRLFGKYLKRGLKIFSLGLIVTLFTWIFIREGFIIFGILHFIGLSIILAYPFLKFRFWNFYLVLGLVITLVGIFLTNSIFDFPWLLWLGIVPRNFFTLDYFPLFPWFGAVLIGLFFGNLLYSNGIRRFRVKDISKLLPVRFFSFLGRHSLFIYFIHQPIIIVLLYLIVL